MRSPARQTACKSRHTRQGENSAARKQELKPAPRVSSRTQDSGYAMPMLSNLDLRRLRLPLAGALLFCGMCLPLASSSLVSARAAPFSPPNLDLASMETVAFETLPNILPTADDLALRIATSQFVRG